MPVFAPEEERAPTPAAAPATRALSWGDLPRAVADVGRSGVESLRGFLGPFADLDRRRGGAPGSHAAALPAPTPVEPGTQTWQSRLALSGLLVFGLATLTWAISMLRQTRCRLTDAAQGFPPYDWMCYTDITQLYRTRGLATGSGVYRDIDWEYPALSGYFAEFTRRLTDLLGVRGGSDLSPNAQLANANLYLALNAIGLFVCFLIVVAVQRQVLVSRPGFILAVACAPAVMTAALINWDLFAVALTALGLLAFTRRRPILAGVWFGLAIAAKVYPVVILGGLFALALRPLVRAYLLPPGRRPTVAEEPDPWTELVRFGRLVVAAGAAWFIANAPLLMTNMERWRYFYSFNQARGPEFGSLWYGLDLAGFTVPGAKSWALTLMALAYLAIAVLVVLAPTKPRVGQVAFLCVAVMVTLNLVYSPQYVLWTLPLIVWALPRWPEQVAFALAELVYYFAVWLYLQSSPWVYFQTDAVSGPPLAYVVTILVRLAVTWWLMGVVVRDIWWPGRDPLRQERGALVDPGPIRWPWRRSAGGTTAPMAETLAGKADWVEADAAQADAVADPEKAETVESDPTAAEPTAAKPTAAETVGPAPVEPVPAAADPVETQPLAAPGTDAEPIPVASAERVRDGASDD